MSDPREALYALMDRVFPRVEPHVQRAPNMRGDDAAVDRRDDERSAVDDFIDALLDDPTLEVRIAKKPKLTETTHPLEIPGRANRYHGRD